MEHLRHHGHFDRLSLSEPTLFNAKMRRLFTDILAQQTLGWRLRKRCSFGMLGRLDGGPLRAVTAPTAPSLNVRYSTCSRRAADARFPPIISLLFSLKQGIRSLETGLPRLRPPPGDRPEMTCFSEHGFSEPEIASLFGTFV